LRVIGLQKEKQNSRNGWPRDKRWGRLDEIAQQKRLRPGQYEKVKDGEEEEGRQEVRKRGEGSQEEGERCGADESAWSRTGCFRM
jgi:hypothetical protein